jgi:hypothetical protein
MSSEPEQWLRAPGYELGDLSYKPRREVLIEEWLQARRSRSAANARQARMSSEVRSGKSAKYLRLGRARREVLEHVVHRDAQPADARPAPRGRELALAPRLSWFGALMSRVAASAPHLVGRGSSSSPASSDTSGTSSGSGSGSTSTGASRRELGYLSRNVFRGKRQAPRQGTPRVRVRGQRRAALAKRSQGPPREPPLAQARVPRRAPPLAPQRETPLERSAGYRPARPRVVLPMEAQTAKPERRKRASTARRTPL